MDRPPPIKARPAPLPESERYWEAARAGELWIQYCVTTGKFFFPPRSFSPFVPGGEVAWAKTSGRATLYSYVISDRPAPGFEGEAPYVIAVVQLAEGPRMMTNIVGVPSTPENLPLDMPLEVAFEDRGEDLFVPVFKPEGGP